MSRSIKKGPFCDDHLMKKVLEQLQTYQICCPRSFQWFRYLAFQFRSS